jgi:hypothetical protein
MEAISICVKKTKKIWETAKTTERIKLLGRFLTSKYPESPTFFVYLNVSLDFCLLFKYNEICIEIDCSL